MKLQKSRRRDPKAVDFLTYSLADAETDELIATKGKTGYGLSLAEIEAALNKR